MLASDSEAATSARNRRRIFIPLPFARRFAATLSNARHDCNNADRVLRRGGGWCAYLTEGTPSLRDVAKVTASLAKREREARGLN
jgi:hypothetical protein